MFFYTIAFIVLYVLTVISGLRYAEGATSGIMISFGKWFDNIFGLTGCRWINGSNQSPPYTNSIYYNCSKPIPFPIEVNSGNVVQPKQQNNQKTTAVAGIGIEVPKISNNRKPVNSQQYISQMLTGNPNGNPSDPTKYNKSKFKHGTPFYNRATDGKNSTGYYYTMDGGKNEVPIFDPLPTDATYYAPSSLRDGTYGQTNPSTGLPEQWKACTKGKIGGGGGIRMITSMAPVGVGDVGNVTFNILNSNENYNKWPIPNSTVNNSRNASTMNYIANTQYLDTEEVYYREFPVEKDASTLRLLHSKA